MSNTRTYLLTGGAIAAAMLLAAGAKRKDEPESTGETPEEDPRPQAGFNPGRFVSRVPSMGTLYEAERGAIMLGCGPKSVAFQVLLEAAQMAGVEHPQDFATDSSRRVAYASMILAAPANAIHLTHELRRNDFRNRQGLGIDLRKRPLLWLPIIDLDMLAQGVVSLAVYEEDGSLGTELPPELREALT